MSVTDDVRKQVLRPLIEEIADDYPDERVLEIDVDQLRSVDTGFVGQMLSNPLTVRETIMDEVEEISREMGNPMARVEIQIGSVPDSVSQVVGEERVEDLHRLVGLEGQLTKRTEVLPKVDEAIYRCQRCQHRQRIDQDFGPMKDPPGICPNCEQKTVWTWLQEDSVWIDHQVIQLQQPPEDAIDGEGSKINVHLLGELAGCLEGGQRLTVHGRYEPEPNKGKATHKRRVRGLGYETQDGLTDIDVSDYEDGIKRISSRENILDYLAGELAPSHYGDQHIKESLVLQLFGGWPREAPDGSYHRGDSHILLIGDPGAGKSNLLQASAEIAPRSAFTDGKGSSAAGLTAALTKDDFGDGQWSIEAGTIVRATGGNAYVDEIDKGDREDLDALHTALERQEVLISKAGKNARLPAKTALTGAGNPTGGHYDPSKEFVEQIELQSPLISRFDLIFVTREAYQRDRIQSVASQIIDSRTAAGKHERGESLDPAERSQIESEIDQDLFTAYVIYAKQNYQPIIRDPALKDDLVDFYTELKMSLPNRYRDTDRDEPPLPVTARKLIAIVRLAEASARMRLSDEIEEIDVERAKRLVRHSMADIGIEPPDGSLGKVSSTLSSSELGI